MAVLDLNSNIATEFFDTDNFGIQDDFQVWNMNKIDNLLFLKGTGGIASFDSNNSNFYFIKSTLVSDEKDDICITNNNN